MDISNRSDLCDSHREEVASLLTHAAGTVLSIAALAVTAAIILLNLLLIYLTVTGQD